MWIMSSSHFMGNPSYPPYLHPWKSFLRISAGDSAGAWSNSRPKGYSWSPELLEAAHIEIRPNILNSHDKMARGGWEMPSRWAVVIDWYVEFSSIRTVSLRSHCTSEVYSILGLELAVWHVNLVTLWDCELRYTSNRTQIHLTGDWEVPVTSQCRAVDNEWISK